MQKKEAAKFRITKKKHYTEISSQAKKIKQVVSILQISLPNWSSAKEEKRVERITESRKLYFV